jgi:hypothetical protein
MYTIKQMIYDISHMSEPLLVISTPLCNLPIIPETERCGACHSTELGKTSVLLEALCLLVDSEFLNMALNMADRNPTFI